MERLFLSFLECKLEGTWDTNLQSSGSLLNYRTGNDCIIDLVEPDGLRRRFRIRDGAIVAMSGSTIIFNKPDVMEELSVDEDAQAGRTNRMRSTL